MELVSLNSQNNAPFLFSTQALHLCAPLRLCVKSIRAIREIRGSIFGYGPQTAPLMFAILVAIFAGATTRAADHPFSLQLEVLERDLASSDYQAIVKTMISTEL